MSELISALQERWEWHEFRQEMGWHLLVALSLVGLTLIISYPLPLRINDTLAGDNVDVHINPWANWWTHKAWAASSESLYHTDYIFYPKGVNLFFFSFSHTNAVLSMLLQQWIDQIAAYNVIVLLAYWLSAFGMYLLVEYLTESSMAGVVSGIIFAFNSYHIAESCHLHLASTQYMPLAVLAFIRWLRDRGVGSFVSTIVLFMVNALTSWHLMFFLAMLLMLFLVHYLLFERHLAWGREAIRLMGFALLTGSLLFPFLWPLIKEQITSSYMTQMNYRGAPMDLRNLVLPLWIGPNSFEEGSYLGIITLILAGIGFWRGGRESRVWGLGGLLFFLIGIGPYPQIDGTPIGNITLLWSRIFIPFLRHLFRFQVLVMFGLAGAAGYGWVSIRDWLKEKSSRWRIPLALGVLSLLILDYSPWPFPTTDFQVSPFYRQLSEEPGSFAIAPIPSNRHSAKHYMYYQTFHGKKITTGHVARTPPEATTRYITMEQLLRSPDLSGHFDRLASAGVRYLVLHKDWSWVKSSNVEQWKQGLPLYPLYEDSQLLVYRTDPRPGRDYTLAHSFTPSLGTLYESVYPAAEVSQGELLEVKVLWALSRESDITHRGRTLKAQLSLIGRDGEAFQTAIFPLSEEWAPSQRLADTLVRGHYQLQVDPFAPPGPSEVYLAVIDKCLDEAVGSPFKLNAFTVTELPREFSPPRSENTLSAAFGDQIELVGYGFQRKEDVLRITLIWHALRRMDTSYKFFIHVHKAPSGALVAQKDFVPHNWTYPTSWWEKGEIVEDEIAISLENIREGAYQVYVGVYHPGTRERLSITDTDNKIGLQVDEGRLQLPGAIKR